MSDTFHEECPEENVIQLFKIMEKADIFSLYEKPQHPYTVGLLQSVPKPKSGTREKLVPIPGSPPDLLNPPTGCPFSPRCPHAMEVCLKEQAPLFKVSDTQYASCWLHHKDAPTVKGYIKTDEVLTEGGKEK